MSKISGKNRKGGVTLVALIFTIVLSTLLAGVFGLVNNQYRSSIRTLDRESAFHVAESGIEIAMLSFKSGITNSQDWQSTGVETYLYEDNSISLGDQTASLKITAEWQEEGKYLITSLGAVQNGGVSVQRAVQSTIDVAGASTTPESGDGVYRYVLFIEDTAYFEQGNNGNNGFVGSFNSDVSFDPNDSLGFDAAIASLKESGVAINMKNMKAWVTALLTKGGAIDYIDQWTGNQSNMNAIFKGKDSVDKYGEGIDVGVIVNDSDFEGTINPVSDPSSDGYPDGNVVSIDQNYTQIWRGDNNCVNQYDDTGVVGLTEDGDVAVGKFEEKTFISTPAFDCDSKDLYVTGDVTIYTTSNMNLNKNVYFTDENSSLTIAGEATLSVVGSIGVLNSDSDAPVYTSRPSQFTLLACGGEGGQDVVIHSKYFVGVVDAPDATVQLNAWGTNKAFLGAIVAKEFTAPRPPNMYYDSRLGEGSGSDNDNGDGSGAVVSVDSWNEVPPSEVVYKFSAVNEVS